MIEHPAAAASGIQIAFLIFAVALLSAPAAHWLTSHGAWARENETLLARLVMFSGAILILAGFAATREMCKRMLRDRILPRHRAEVLCVTAMVIAGNIAAGGAIAAWLVLQGGKGNLASHLQINSEVEVAKAVSLAGLALIPLAWLVGPLIEELVFRGFLYRAWARRWHWLIAMGLTAVAFGLYHPYFFSSFASSIVFTCLIRRTGSLRSSIFVHAVGNTTLWYPFLGQYVFPSALDNDITKLSAWWIHGACLVLFAIFLPAYVWLARDKS